MRTMYTNSLMRARLESAISVVPILVPRRLPMSYSQKSAKLILSRRDDLNEYRKLHERYFHILISHSFRRPLGLHIGNLGANFLLKDDAQYIP